MSQTVKHNRSRQPKPSKRRSINNFLQVAGILPILIIICILFALLSPNFLTAGNAVNILRQASINIVLATGMTFVILTGGIDLSVGSVLAVSAVVGVLVSLLPAIGWLAVPVALLTGLLSGLAGVMSASRLYSATGMLGQGYELDAIAAVLEDKFYTSRRGDSRPKGIL